MANPSVFLSPSDIKLYLTSVEPDIAQTIYSQSIGGYLSVSLLYPETTVSQNIGLYEKSLVLTTPSSGTWSEWTNVRYLSINNEIIKVINVAQNNVDIVDRAINDVNNMHISGDEVRGIVLNTLLNDVFNEDRKQYRCLAVKNTSGTETGYNMNVYLYQKSLNYNSTIKIALEIPKSQYFANYSSSWDNMHIIDNSLSGLYADNYFKDVYIRIPDISGLPNAGQGRLVNSFDSNSGTFTFYSSFPTNYNSSLHSNKLSYIIDPSPSQRIKTGTVHPVIGTSSITTFMSPTINNPLSLNLSGNIGGGNFLPNNIFYIWLERYVKKGASYFEENDIIININYDLMP